MKIADGIRVAEIAARPHRAELANDTDRATDVDIDGATDVDIDIEPGWGDSWRVLARRRGVTVFGCTVTPRPQGLWSVSECLPRRRDPALPAVLRAVVHRLGTERGAPAMIVFAPTDCDDDLAAGGATLLARIVPMRLALDDDLLRLRSQPVPTGWALAPLTVSAETPTVLAGLSADPDREGDRRVWQEICAGDFGPIIPDASLILVEGTALRAAIAVTEYQGAPLLAHVVTATTQRASGLGRALLIDAMTGLSRSGYVDCHLNVVEDNWVARRLYRSTGFAQSGPTLRASHLSTRVR